MKLFMVFFTLSLSQFCYSFSNFGIHLKYHVDLFLPDGLGYRGLGMVEDCWMKFNTYSRLRRALLPRIQLQDTSVNDLMRLVL